MPARRGILSTFSFSGMIKNALSISALLLAVWSLAVTWLPAGLDTGQTMRGDNLIRAEDFLYTTEMQPNDVALVGSSLSEKLTVGPLPGRKVHNLGFGGQRALDGLDLLLAGPQLPAVVLVETNILQPGGNSDLETSLFNPVGFWIRRYVPALRHRYQPVGVVKGLITGKEPAQAARGQDRPLNEQSLALKVEAYATAPAAATLAEELEALQQRINRLERSGVRVVFYETPVHPALCSAPKAEALRVGYRKVFLPDKFTYLEQPDCAAFRTTDGHHLGEQSNEAYSQWLTAAVATLLKE